MDPLVIIVMTAVTGLFMAAVLFAVWRTQRSPSPAIGQSHLTGPLLPLGTAGEVRSPIGPTGTIYAKGEEWTAWTDSGRILRRGTPVRVTGNDGMVLIVEPMPTSEMHRRDGLTHGSW